MLCGLTLKENPFHFWAIFELVLPEKSVSRTTASTVEAIQHEAIANAPCMTTNGATHYDSKWELWERQQHRIMSMLLKLGEESLNIASLNPYSLE